MAALREPRGQAGSTKDVIVIVGASIGVSAAGAGTPSAQRVNQSVRAPDALLSAWIRASGPG
jgi:hypothetical protein